MKEPVIDPGAIPLAHEVHRRMIAAGLRQKSLALKAGLNPTYVRDLFRGRSRNPKERELSKLAAALKCELSDLANPRGSGAEPLDKDCVKDIEEIRLLDIWRTLTPQARLRFLLGGQAAIPRRHDGTDPDDV